MEFRKKKVEDLFRRLLENAPDAMVIVNERGIMEIVNSQTELLFGYSAAELVGEPVEKLIPSRFRSSHVMKRDSYFSSPRTRPMGSGLSLHGQRKNGEEFSVEISLSPLRMPEGLYVTAAIRDVTNQRKAADALEKANRELEAARADLEKRVTDRTRALMKTNRNLETMLHVISHDLSEPIRGIASFSRLVKERYGNLLDDRGRDYLHRIFLGCERMNLLLKEILNLSRVHQGIEIQEKCAVDNLVKEVLVRMDEEIRRKGGLIEINHRLPALDADPVWFKEALYNLVANALKFTRDGAPPEIRIDPYSGPEGRGLLVADRGPGVPDNLKSRVFELFQRGVGREIPGTGAGLAIVLRIAEAHGGCCMVRDREGGGSEFILVIESTKKDVNDSGKEGEEKS